MRPHPRAVERVLALAAPALAATDPVGDEVVTGEFVTPLTVRPGRVDCRGAVSPHDVFSVRDRLEMCRVNAATNPAHVIELQAFRNRSHERFVGDAMGIT
jgi:hypothetical protein